MSATDPSPKTVSAELTFFSPPPDGSKPWTNVDADRSNGQQSNWSKECHVVEIENLRGKEDSVTLDTAGFQFFRRPSAHEAFTDDTEIEKEYYTESIELVKEITGASRAQRRQPVALAHVDQTTASSIARVHRHLPPSDVPSLLRRRFQVINLWRPISHPAYDWPLALCDYRSVDPKEDLVPTTLKFQNREGESMSVKFNPNQKWKYLRGMEPDECVLLKCFDSKTDDGNAVLAPHTAFADPSASANAPYRESIELRLLVFYD